MILQDDYTEEIFTINGLAILLSATSFYEVIDHLMGIKRFEGKQATKTPFKSKYYFLMMTLKNVKAPYALHPIKF